MRLRQAVSRLRYAEVAVFCVGAQAVGLKILFAMMADGDALFWPRAFRCRHASLTLDGLARGGFGGGLARRRFFLRGRAACCPRCRLLLGHRALPSRVMGKR